MHTTPDGTSCLPRDLAVAFAALRQNGDTVVNWREISKRYIRNWFIIDFLSTVPVDKLVRSVHYEAWNADLPSSSGNVKDCELVR